MESMQNFNLIGPLVSEMWIFKLIFICKFQKTTSLVYWARLTAIQEVPGSIPGYILEIFLEV